MIAATYARETKNSNGRKYTRTPAPTLLPCPPPQAPLRKIGQIAASSLFPARVFSSPPPRFPPTTNPLHDILGGLPLPLPGVSSNCAPPPRARYAVTPLRRNTSAVRVCAPFTLDRGARFSSPEINLPPLPLPNLRFAISASAHDFGFGAHRRKDVRKCRRPKCTPQYPVAAESRK